MTIFWIDASNAIVSASSDDGVKPARAIQGIYDGVDTPPPEDTITGPAPENGTQTWLGAAWSTPPPPPTKVDAPLTAEELAAHLVTRNVITQGEITAIKNAR